MPIAPGTRMGRYRLVERAGAGGMSEVWKAEDETLHRTVAVKVIGGPIGSDPTYRERFLREARLVAGLEHPFVLPVYDFGAETIDGLEIPFLVMPLVAGGSLKERVRRPVPPAQAVSWLAALASALDLAHARGILHRDIKPGNVLMGSGDRPLLADFGLARSTESASGLTATGTVLGTPLYMAPEQATGKALDARADQYALAVIAFEMLAGRVPFQADTPLAVLHQHVNVPPAAISQAAAGIPEAADAVLHRALAKRPAERFDTCTEFVGALAQALGVPLTAPTTPVSVAVAASSASPSGPPRPVPPPVPQPSTGLSQQATVIADPTPRVSAMAAPASVAAPPRRRLAWALVPAAVLLVTAAVLFSVKRGAPDSEVAQIPSTVPPVTPPLPTPIPTEPPPSPPAEPTPAPEPTTPPTATPVPPTPVPTLEPVPEREPRGRFRRDGGEPGEARAAAALPRREPLLLAPELSSDTTLGGAFHTLDSSRRPEGKLDRSDFVSAMGEARSALSRRRTPDALFLDAYSRAGVAFADGRRVEAWQLLRRALESDGGAASSRALRFVRREVNALGANPGPDADWVMGLAFADVRGDLDEELRKASERAGSAAVAYAMALRAVDRRDGAEAHRLARRACAAGLREACELLR